MSRKHSNIRSLVRREGAQRYVLIVLLSFAASLALTRLYLEAAGYPKLGGGGLHIAHVLWGGLMLFLAALAPLVFANRAIYTAASFLGGAGAGLFIDEVGKFITEANDYFYPPAAPLVYAFFLLTLFVYAQIRKPPSRDPRAEMYRILESFQEVLDHDLEDDERAALITRLTTVAHARDSHLAQLAEDMLRFLRSEHLPAIPPQTDALERAQELLADMESRWLTRPRWRILLACLFAGLGISQWLGLLQLLLAIPSPEVLQGTVRSWMQSANVAGTISLQWFIAHLTTEAAVGTLLICASALLVVRKEKAGISLGILGLLLLLCVVNLLVFYFDQFSTILPAAAEFAILIAAIRYRNKYFIQHPRAAHQIGVQAPAPPTPGETGEGIERTTIKREG